MVLVGNHFLTEGQIQTLRPRVTFTLSSVWSVERTDGDVKRFATHDKWVRFQNQDYKPIGPSPSTMEQVEAGGESDFEMFGFLSDDSIKPSDVHAGKYDGAKVTQYVVDFMRPWRWVRKHVWWLKTLTENGEVFRAQVQGSEKFWTIPVGRYYEIECDHTLGGTRCGATPGAHFGLTVTDVASPTGQIIGSSSARSGFEISGFTAGIYPWAGGSVTFTNGPNKGIKREIGAHDGGDNFNTVKPFPFPIKSGDVCSLSSGCDGSAETCRSVYDNLDAHGGLQHMPTTADTYQRPDEK